MPQLLRYYSTNELNKDSKLTLNQENLKSTTKPVVKTTYHDSGKFFDAEH